MIKYILITVFAALAIWLAITPAGSGNRVGKIYKRYGSNFTSLLNQEEELQFENLVHSITRAAGIKQPILINSLPKQQKDFETPLKFFVTSESDHDFTFCEKGNAIYDAQLNAVFIDISLVKATDWMIYDPKSGMQLNNSDLPFIRTYLIFVLLHELGHYTMHHASGGFFDFFQTKNNPSFRKKEAEADSFSINKMAIFLQQDTFYFKRNELGSSIDLDIPDDAPPGVASIISLLEMGNNITLGMEFGISPYSPFYSDAAHPTYLSRVKSMVSSILQTTQMDKKIAAEAMLIYNYMSSLENIGETRQIISAATDDPLKEINFASNGDLLIMPVSGKGIYRIPQASIVRSLEKHTNLAPSWAAPFFKGYKKLFYDSSERATLFSLNGGATWCIKEKNFLFKQTGTMFSNPADTGWSRYFKTGGPSFAPPQPGDFFLVATDTSLAEFRNEQTKEITLASITLHIPTNQAGAKYFVDVFKTIINADFAGIPIYLDQKGDDKRLCGIAYLALNGLSFVKYVPTDLPDSIFAANDQYKYFADNQNALFFDADNLENIYFTTFATDNNKISGWNLWLSAGKAKPVLVSSYPFINKNIPGKELLRDYQPELFGESQKNVRKNEFLLNWNGDYVFKVKVKQAEAVPVFFPGDENLSIRLSATGLAVLFEQGTKKFYIEKI